MTVNAIAPSTPARTVRPEDAEALALFSLLTDLPAGADRERIRGRVIELYMPLARHLAGRFRNRGAAPDDLEQVAYLGLIKAVDGFDAGRGIAFVAYAIPMVVGELKRYFRDKCWDVRIPRRLQETHLAIGRVTAELTHRLGRAPTVADLAAAVDVDEETVLETLDAARSYRSLSLDAPVANGAEGVTGLGDLLGGDDPDIERAEARVALQAVLARLPQREQRIIAMRFYGNATQSQIAAELGLSQMHVSRLLSQALGRLRQHLQQG